MDETGGDEDSHSGTAGDLISITANTGNIGCQVEVVTDGSSWYAVSITDATGAITSD